MRKLFSLILVALAISIVSFQYPYKKLSKLYKTNSGKCLSKAKKMMNYFSSNPAPYYFASCVHYDQAQTQVTARRKYNDMTKALMYARSLERLRDESFESKVSWDKKSVEMNEYTLDLMDELKSKDLKKLGDQLKSRLKRLKWDYKRKKTKPEEVLETKEVLASTESESSPAVPESKRVAGQYYGLATGAEVIPSHNMKSEMQMLRMINEARKEKGMGTLEWNEDLTNAARYHAYDMGTQKYFSHDSQDRSKDKLVEVAGTFDRIRQFYKDSFVNSENIAAGNEGASATYDQWYNSPGHYENLFNASSKKVGIGVVQCENSPFVFYWVFCTAL